MWVAFQSGIGYQTRLFSLCYIYGHITHFIKRDTC
uniref:Uncharacterized protein n=1 Tax=Anguilla anguilla TaxID=7936 RepID=A0A0E9V1Z2_ANGAN